MEFNEKLTKLRKQKELTQEELASALFVSRTAVSKWEQGKGYPNIDSLKAIAKFFDVTIDELLSTDEVLSVAQEDNKQKQMYIRDLVYALLDISTLMFLFLPLFGIRADGGVQSVSLLSLFGIELYIRIAFFCIVIAAVLWGVLTLALQNFSCSWWLRCKSIVSLSLSVIGVLIFIASRQTYAATVLFVFFAIKVLMSAKSR